MICIFEISIISHFGFEGRLWVLIVPVPGNCLSFTFHATGVKFQRHTILIIHSYACITNGFFYFVVLDSVAAQQILPYSIALESSLRTDLFSDYDVLQKPAETVDVYVKLNLVSLNEMDIKSQTFSISGYFSMKWQDDRLSWVHNSSLVSVRLLFSNSKYMWVPPIILENTIDDIVPLRSEKVYTHHENMSV